MKNIRLYRRISYVFVLVLLLLTTACGANQNGEESQPIYYYPKETQTKVEQLEEEEELYLIVSIDQSEEIIRLYRFANQMAYQYYYTLHTDFLDKYGNYSSVANFVPGRAVYIDQVDEHGVIGKVQVADSVWEYDDVAKFSVDEERGIFYIADTKYNYDENLFVFSDATKQNLSDLTENDVLTVIGKDKKILSVMVTTGHGKLQLLNTGLFEDSFLQLNTSIFAMITPNLLLEVPEGTYTLSVANDGWGGTTQIEITRGTTTEVDLDLLKGEGPQYGQILFMVDLDDVTIRIDGEKIDYSAPVKLRYGWHSLVVASSVYEDWSKRLYVNSKEATVEIELDDGSVSKIGQVESETEEADSQTDSQVQAQTEESSESTENIFELPTADEITDEYLTTLTEMLDSL